MTMSLIDIQSPNNFKNIVISVFKQKILAVVYKSKANTVSGAELLHLIVCMYFIVNLLPNFQKVGVW